MPSRKRSLAAIDGDDGEKENSLQHRIRNMWQFANLCQWIYIFGKAAKIDEAIDVEVWPQMSPDPLFIIRIIYSFHFAGD